MPLIRNEKGVTQSKVKRQILPDPPPKSLVSLYILRKSVRSSAGSAQNQLVRIQLQPSSAVLKVKQIYVRSCLLISIQLSLKTS